MSQVSRGKISKENDDTADLARKRDRMVEHQIIARGITDARVLSAMRRVPRHGFVPVESASSAYEDHPSPIGCGQTISQPYMVGLMTELLALKPCDRVLEIGTGSAYQTAILAELAQEVISIERHGPLAEAARRRLEESGYGNVAVIHGDGTLGHAERAPYDAILVTAGAPDVPSALKDQLAVGGRLVCPVGPRDIQTLVTVVRTPAGFEEKRGISCVFVLLLGSHGWPDSTD